MADLVIKISGDIADFKTSLEEASSATQDLEDSLQKTAAISGVAFAALTAAIGVTVKAYGETEAAAKDMNLVLQDQGLYSQDLVDSYKEQADAISQLTGIDADNITQGQVRLQQMIGQTEISQELSQAMVDLATRTGSLDSAASLLGKGIEGNTTMLKRFGIEIDDNLDKQQRMEQIIAAVNTQFGGMAAVANTGLGSIQGLKTAFDEFEKAIGAEFAPLITEAIQVLTDFFKALAGNKPLVDLVATLLAFAAGATGAIFAITSIGAAFLALTPLVEAFGLTLATALGPITLAVAGIGLLTGGLAAYALHSKNAKDATEDLDGEITQLQTKIEGYQNALKNQVPYAVGASNMDDLKKRIIDAGHQLDILKAKEDDQRRGAGPRGVTSGGDDSGQDAKKKQAADKRAAEERERDAMTLQAVKDHHAALIDELNFHDAEIVKLEKEQGDIEAQLATKKHGTEKEDLKKKLAEIREILADANIQENNEHEIYEDEILAKDKYYQSLSLEERRKFAQQNQAVLQASIDTQAKARQKAALAEAQDRIKLHNQFLQDEIKFGTAYATINQAMHSAVYQGSKQAFGELEQLSNSHNSTLKAIGKVAAVANIVIKTAESAMNIYAGFSTIPIVGPALGVIGAAAAIAYGAEQVQTVTSAAQGGLITGGIPGIDSVPVLAQHGELVVPQKNFEEVVGAVADSRSGGGHGSIMIGFDGPEAQRVITVRQNQAKALGTYVGVS